MCVHAHATEYTWRPEDSILCQFPPSTMGVLVTEPRPSRLASSATHCATLHQINHLKVGHSAAI